VKLGKKRRESSKRNYYIISPRVIIKAIIIISEETKVRIEYSNQRNDKIFELINSVFKKCVRT